MKTFPLFLMVFVGFAAIAQESESEPEEQKIINRIFMPSLQMGYVENISDDLSGGLFIQTSIEYQLPVGVFFRVNYDDFDSDFELTYNRDSLGTLEGEVSFSELVGGVGYRHSIKKHSVYTCVQAGARFYGYPSLAIDGNRVSIEMDNQVVGMNRYTLGYDYEVFKRVFVVAEVFGSHPWEQKDYWKSNIWTVGATIGLTANIF